MGMSIVLIMLFHSHIGIPDVCWPLDLIKTTGYLGVDIFFLLSGFGLSYSKKPIGNLKNYFFRRAFRILPVFWACLVLMLLVGAAIQLDSITPSYLSFLGLDFILKGSLTTWYIPAIVICYFIFPIQKHFSEKYGYWKVALAFSFIAFSLSISISNGALDYLLIFTIRLPAFFIGVALGNSIINREFKNKLKFYSIIAAAALIPGLWAVTYFVSFETLNSTGLRWYPTVLLAAPLTFLLADFCGWLSLKLKKIYSLMVSIGNHSLELYLGHLLIFAIGVSLNLSSSGLNYSRILEYSFYFIISYALAIFLKRVSSPITNIYGRVKAHP